jgi:hypothetical protein
MSYSGYEKLSGEEMVQLKKSFLRAKLIDKYEADELVDNKFDKSLIIQLISRPREFEFAKET